MKEKLKKNEYLNSLIKGLTTWSVCLVSCLGLFLNWTREELKNMDQRTTKKKRLKVLYVAQKVDKLCLTRNEGGRELINFNYFVDMTIQVIEEYTNTSKKKKREYT